jgi:hypothetical protein
LHLGRSQGGADTSAKSRVAAVGAVHDGGAKDYPSDGRANENEDKRCNVADQEASS